MSNFWECPCCHTRITNTQLHQAAMNFPCAGVFGSGARRIRCGNSFSGYEQVDVSQSELLGTESHNPNERENE